MQKQDGQGDGAGVGLLVMHMHPVAAARPQGDVGHGYKLGPVATPLRARPASGATSHRQWA